MSKEVKVTKLPYCDFCRVDYLLNEASVDGKTIHGPWAYMCQNHFDDFGVGLGLGLGQRLVKE